MPLFFTSRFITYLCRGIPGFEEQLPIDEERVEAANGQEQGTGE